MKRTLLVVAALVATTCAPNNENKDIVVGEYGSLTGSEATFGQSTHNGITLAVEEINAAGGIGGRKIRVITEDDQSKAEEAANAVTKLDLQQRRRRHHRRGRLVELARRRADLPAEQSADDHAVVDLSRRDEEGRLHLSDVLHRHVSGSRARRASSSTISHVKTRRALHRHPSDYSTGLGKAFEEVFTSLGGTDRRRRQSYSKGDSDYRSQLTAFKAANPEVIVVPGYYNDVAPIAVQARDLGINVPLVGGDGWESPKLLEIGGKALEGCMYSNHYHADDPAPAVRGFVTKYAQRFGARPDSLAALGYDTTRVLADAMRRAGPKFTRATLRDAIAATRSSPSSPASSPSTPNRNPIGKTRRHRRDPNGQLALKRRSKPV